MTDLKDDTAAGLDDIEDGVADLATRPREAVTKRRHVRGDPRPRWRRGSLAALVALSSVAGTFALPSTSAAHDPMYPKIGFHFRLGLGGDHERRAGGPRDGMEPSFGGGVELEVPVTTHFSLGGAFEAYGWAIGRAGGSYNVSLDFLFMPRFRIPFGDHPWHAEVYLGIPMGPTVNLPHDRFANAVGTPLDAGIGITGGGRLGARLNLDEIVGLFADVGPMIQFVSYPSQTGGSRVESWHYQFVIRAGASFGFR